MLVNAGASLTRLDLEVFLRYFVNIQTFIPSSALAPYLLDKSFFTIGHSIFSSRRVTHTLPCAVIFSTARKNGNILSIYSKASFSV